MAWRRSVRRVANFGAGVRRAGRAGGSGRGRPSAGRVGRAGRRSPRDLVDELRPAAAPTGWPASTAARAPSTASIPIVDDPGRRAGERVDRLDLAAEHRHDPQREHERRPHAVVGPAEVGARDPELVDALAPQQLAGRELVLDLLERVDPGPGVAARACISVRPTNAPQTASTHEDAERSRAVAGCVGRRAPVLTAIARDRRGGSAARSTHHGLRIGVLRLGAVASGLVGSPSWRNGRRARRGSRSAHLRRAEAMCRRRLAREHAGLRGSWNPPARFAVSNRLVEDARVAHAELRAARADRFPGARPICSPSSSSSTGPRPAATWPSSPPARRAPSPSTRGRPSSPTSTSGSSGSLGLALETADGAPELRSLRLGVAGNRPLIDDAERRVIVVRSAAWVGDRPLRRRRRRPARGRGRRGGARRRRRAARGARVGRGAGRGRHASAPPTRSPKAGSDCRGCPFVPGCQAHAAVMTTARPRARAATACSPHIVTITPTAYETWKRCHARVPAHPPARGAAERRHPPDRPRSAAARAAARRARAGHVPRRRARPRRARGPRRRRPALRRDAGAARAALPRRGRERCARGRSRALSPQPGADVHGDRAHRRDLGARRHPRRPRLQDRLALVRAGRRRPARRVQAFVLEPHAQPTRPAPAAPLRAPRGRGRRRPRTVRTRRRRARRDRRRAARDRRRALVARRMAAASPTRAVCKWCRFRSICPDSAAPGEPGWPVLALGIDAGAAAGVEGDRRDRPPHTRRRRRRTGRAARRAAGRARADRRCSPTRCARPTPTPAVRACCSARVDTVAAVQIVSWPYADPARGVAERARHRRRGAPS